MHLLTGDCVALQGEPSAERRESAKDAILFMNENVIPMVNILTNEREKRRRLKAIKRVRNRLQSTLLSQTMWWWNDPDDMLRAQRLPTAEPALPKCHAGSFVRKERPNFYWTAP